MEVILPQLIAKIFRNHNRVTHLWMVFTAWWNRSQLTLLHQYFHEHHEYDELITGDLRLGDVLAENSDLLPGMVRSLLQWPAVQMDPEFWLNPRIHVCPRCELPIPQNGELEAETMTFTSYCTTAVHTRCFIPGTLSCEVCSHENCNIRIPVFFDGPQMLKALLHIITICNLLYHWCGFGGGTISVGCINGPYVLSLTALHLIGATSVGVYQWLLIVITYCFAFNRHHISGGMHLHIVGRIFSDVLWQLLWRWSWTQFFVYKVKLQKTNGYYTLHVFSKVINDYDSQFYDTYT